MNAEIVVSQSFKPSTGSEELSFRVSRVLLKKLSMDIGDRADVLFDESQDLWMIKKINSEKNGYAISGKKEGGPTGLIRYTLKPGHAKLTDNRADLPIKKVADESTFKFNDNSLIFSLK